MLCFREDNRNTLGLACSCLCIWQNAATAYVAHGRLPAHTLYRGFDLELERGKVAERERGARYARDGNQSRRPAHDDDDDEEKLYALIQYIDVGQKCATCLSAIAAAPLRLHIQPAVPLQRAKRQLVLTSTIKKVRQLVEVQRDNDNVRKPRQQ